jgi:hypothetical protein
MQLLSPFPGSGKLGGVVGSRGRAGYQLRARVASCNPRSSGQQQARARTGALASLWRSLPPGTRVAWDSLASGNQSGYNLFVANNRRLATLGVPSIVSPPRQIPSLPTLAPFTVAPIYDTNGGVTTLTAWALTFPFIGSHTYSLVLRASASLSQAKANLRPSDMPVVQTWLPGTAILSKLTLELASTELIRIGVFGFYLYTLQTTFEQNVSSLEGVSLVLTGLTSNTWLNDVQLDNATLVSGSPNTLSWNANLIAHPDTPYGTTADTGEAQVPEGALYVLASWLEKYGTLPPSGAVNFGLNYVDQASGFASPMVRAATAYTVSPPAPPVTTNLGVYVNGVEVAEVANSSIYYEGTKVAEAQ